MSTQIDLKKFEDGKIKVHHSEAHLTPNYKNITRDAIDKLKELLLRYGQQRPIWIDIRPDRLGNVVDGRHQYVAIGELIQESKWKDSDLIWIEPKNPEDDNEAKTLALIGNTQFDNPTAEALYEWAGQAYFDSSEPLGLIPVTFDSGTETTMLDVIDFLGPSKDGEDTKDTKEPKEKKDIKCPKCGHMFKEGEQNGTDI